jgi:hypothetical protein
MALGLLRVASGLLRVDSGLLRVASGLLRVASGLLRVAPILNERPASLGRSQRTDFEDGEEGSRTPREMAARGRHFPWPEQDPEQELLRVDAALFHH